MWLLSASPCSNALERAKPPIAVSTGALAPTVGTPQQWGLRERGAGEQPSPSPAARSPAHPPRPSSRHAEPCASSPPPHARLKSVPLGALTAPPHLTASAGSFVPARETCLRARAWLKNSLMAAEMVFTLLKETGTARRHRPPGTGHPGVPRCPPRRPGGLPVGVHVFGEIQMDKAAVAPEDQGSEELPGRGHELCRGGLAQPGDGLWAELQRLLKE